MTRPFPEKYRAQLEAAIRDIGPGAFAEKACITLPTLARAVGGLPVQQITAMGIGSALGLPISEFKDSSGEGIFFRASYVLIARLDAEAEKRSVTRSDVIRELLFKALDR